MVLFRNVTLVLPDASQENGWLRVAADGRIEALGTAAEPGGAPVPGETVVDGGGSSLLAPGFIDGHVHGALGRDAMEADTDGFATICGFHAAAGGTTALALASVAAPDDALRRLLTAAAEFRAAQAPGEGARLLGVHVEGPYFAASRAGAHRPEYLRAPDPAEYLGWLRDFAGLITQMTLAPERPGALPLITALTERGILASAGHSEATDAEAEAARGAGLRHVTHLFNAMSTAARRPGSPFRVAGLTEWALASPPPVRCEIIADGRHVSPTLLRLAFQAKGADGLCLITDATGGAGLPEGSGFRLGALEKCTVRDGVGMTHLADGTPALAGSTATMLGCVRNAVRLAGATLPEAVRMATLTPARALGLAHERGELAVGRIADLVLLSPDAGIAGRLPRRTPAGIAALSFRTRRDGRESLSR